MKKEKRFWWFQKVKKRSLRFLFFGFLFLVSEITFAASLELTADKTNLTKNDFANLHLSVSGPVDNSEIAIIGLSNFQIVGQLTSQNISIVNGVSNIVQENSFQILPKRSGKIEVQAVAKSGGKEIRSQKIIFSVADFQNSGQALRNNLIQTQQTQQNVKPLSDNLNNNFAKEDLKKLLKEPSRQDDNLKKNKTLENEFENFPKVEHISAFNKRFWLEVFGMIFLILASILMTILIAKNLKRIK